MAEALTIQGMQPWLTGLNAVTAPETTRINQQIADLTPYYDAQTKGLEQARINAFRDIGSQARQRGGLFSGFSPDQMARYTGEKFLPAMAGLKKSQNEATSALQQALNQVGINNYSNAWGMYGDAAKFGQSERQFEQNMAWDKEKFAKELAASAASRASSGSSKTYYTEPSANGGTNFFDPNGNPIRAAQYFNATGGGAPALVSFLQTDVGGKGAYNDIQKGLTPAQLSSKYPWIF